MVVMTRQREQQKKARSSCVSTKTHSSTECPQSLAVLSSLPKILIVSSSSHLHVLLSLLLAVWQRDHTWKPLIDTLAS